MDHSDDARDRDRSWAERLFQGDTLALEEIYDAYSGPLFHQALALVGSTSDAEDVLQNVFLKVVQRRTGSIRDLKSYLFTAVRHEAYSSLRRRKKELLSEETGMISRPSPRSDNDEVEEALLSLPPEQREVVLLKVYDQMTFEEIGRVVKTSANTVASRYRYALKKLRELLGENIHA